MISKAKPGSFVWLLAHELSLNWRSAGMSKRGRWIAAAFFASYFIFGCVVAYWFKDIEISPSTYNYVVAFFGASALLLVDLSAGLRSSQRVLYESGDLELLLSSPIAPRRILMAKLFIIAAASMMFQAILIFPLLLPLAVLGHPVLFAAIGVSFAISFYGACLGLAITLLFVRIGGPRAAKRMIQIFAAFVGATIFILSQVIATSSGEEGSRTGALTNWYLNHGYGTSGLTSLPGKAAFGDPFAFLIICGGAILLFLASAWSLETLFLRSYQAAGNRASTKKPSKKNFARHFNNNFRLNLLRKELRLILRDPVLIFFILQKIIYIAPVMFLLMALTPSSVMIFAKLPGASFLSVLMAGQLLGDLVSLTIFGEDAPDLLKVSPRPAKELTRLKLLAACLIGGPIILIVPLLMFFISTNAALITLAFTLLSACLAGLIELKITKPTTKRKSTLRREISVLSTVLTLAMIAVVGGVCSLLVYGVS